MLRRNRFGDVFRDVRCVRSICESSISLITWVITILSSKDFLWSFGFIKFDEKVKRYNDRRNWMNWMDSKWLNPIFTSILKFPRYKIFIFNLIIFVLFIIWNISLDFSKYRVLDIYIYNLSRKKKIRSIFLNALKQNFVMEHAIWMFKMYQTFSFVLGKQIRDNSWFNLLPLAIRSKVHLLSI